MGAGGDGGSGGRSSEAGSATIFIRFANGSKFSVDVALESIVGDLKAVLAERCEVPAAQQKLIYKGRILQDDNTLSSYGIESQHTIHLVRGLVSSTPTAVSSGTGLGTSAPRESSLESASSPAVSRNISAFFGFPPSESDEIFGNEASSFLPELGQLPQRSIHNPNMWEITNMPVVQNLLNNPEIMRNFIMSNPQMRQVIDRNPELAHVLNDPGTLRQTLEAARNPELMREMMRMSNIESAPEGFNMLRRMYETVQEPLLSATNIGTDTGTSPAGLFAATLGNNGTAQSAIQSSSPSGADSVAIAGATPTPNTNPLPNPWIRTAGNTLSRIIRTYNTNGVGVTSIDERIVQVHLPGLERLIENSPDKSFTNQLIQNSEMAQLIQSLLSNPQFVNQMLRSNPQIRSLMESNPQLRDALQNPEMLRQLISPSMLQQLMSLHQSLLSQSGDPQSGQVSNRPGGGSGPPNFRGLESLLGLFGNTTLGGGVPSNPVVPPEELYATQLAQLHEMGFFDTQKNIRALVATAGNIHAAVERLLQNLNQ